MNFKYHCKAFALALSTLFIKPESFLGQTIQVGFGSVTAIPADFMGFNGSNVIRPDNPFFDDSNLINKFSELSAGNSRFPAGEIANWWDWRIGCIKTTLPSDITIRGDLESLNYKDNTLNRYKTLVDRSVVTPLFDLNLMTSNRFYEAAGLYYANGLNLPVKYIEFGTEFYLDKDEYIAKYPSAKNYAADANAWAAYLRTLPGGPSLKIAALGAVDKYPAEPHYSRQNVWTPQLLPFLSNDINAVTLHNYVGGNTGASAVSLSNLPSVMAAPFQSWASLSPELNLIRSYGKDVWITEFNLFDRSHCLQGTWASGLFASAMQLTFNEDTIVKVTTCHTMVGNAIWSMIFNDSTEFQFSDFYFAGTNCLSNAPFTDKYEFSAAGNTMSLTGKAMLSATTRRPFTFLNAPTLPGGYPALYGWQFDGVSKTAAVLLNLDSTDKTITIDTLLWNVSGGTMQQLYPGPGGPLALIKGNAVANPGANEITTTGIQSATQTILLRKYSITYLEKKQAAVVLKVMDNTICSGTYTTAGVRGGTSYNWSGGNLASITADNSVMRFTAPTVATTTTYTITVTDLSGSSATASITVYPKPVLNSSINFSQVCKGYPVKLTAQLTGGNASKFQSFIWIQDDGNEISNCMNPVVNVTPKKSTTYFVVATDGNCWANIDSQKVVINAVADAGVNRFVCTDSLPFTLTANNVLQGYTYKWFQNNSLLNIGTTASVSPTIKTTYKLVLVNNNDGQCTDTSYISLDPVVCCASSDTAALTFGNYITAKQFGLYMQAYCSATGIGTAGAQSLSNFNKEIVFNGTFAMDRSYTFYNCPKIRFGERAEIKFIANAATLNIAKCSLTAASCSGKMWSGIKGNLYNVIVNVDSSTISGAETAIEVQDDAVLNVRYCTIKDNYKGLDVFDYTDDLEGVIKGDSFIYTSLLPPHAGQRTFCGICAEDATGVRVGDSTVNEPANYFSNLDYGIYAPGADVDVYNNKFANFYPDDTINANEGSAIYSFNKNGGGNLADTSQLWPDWITRIGSQDGGTKGNTFQDCKYAINTMNIGLLAKGNTFSNTVKAITNSNSMFKILEASNNTISKSKAAIEFLLAKTSKLTINSNTITTDTAYNDQSVLAGIRVVDDPLNMSTLSLDGNVVNLYGTHGIYIVSNDYGKFIDNKVNIKQNNLQFDVYGYRFEDCDSADFSCNAAKGNSNLQMAHKKGVVVINSDQWRLRCSNIDKIETGMEMIGNCNWMQLRNNEYYNCNVALQIGADGLTGGIIGPQPQFGVIKPNGNKFFGNGTSTRGTFGLAATRAVNSFCAGGQFDTTRFYVYNIDSVWVPYPNIVSGSGSAITPYYTTRTPNGCNATCDNPNPARPRPKHKAAPVVNDDDGEGIEVMSVENYNTVADKLMNLDFQNPLQYNVAQSLYQIIGEQNSEDVSLNKFSEKIRSTNLAAFNMIEKKLAELNNSNLKNRYVLLEELINANANIVPDNLPETNQKLFNAAVLTSMKTGNFNKELFNQLKFIAYQCPYTGGDAVFKARALYTQKAADINYNDELLCRIAEQSRTKSDKEPATYLHAYPVPAKDIVEVDYLIDGNSVAQLQVADLTGRNIFTQPVSSDYMHSQLNLSSLNSGAYVLHLMVDGKLVRSIKLIIAR